MRNSQPFMNADDVAARLGLNRKTVYKLAKEGALDSFRIGRKLLFAPADIEKYLQTSKFAHDLSEQALQARTQQNFYTTESSDGLVLSGNELAADIIANYMQTDAIPLVRQHLNSYFGLVKLYQNDVDAVVLHLYDQRTRTYNIPYVQRLAPGVPLVVMRLFQRPIGLLVRQREQASTLNYLLREDVRIATRPCGYATRIFLDELMLGLEANLVRAESRYVVCESEREIAEAVAEGRAEVGVATADAQQFAENVQLVPLQTERVDIAIRKSERTRDFLNRLVALTQNKTFVKHIADTTVGTVDELGVIVYEC